MCLRVFMWIMPLKQQQRWKDGEHGDWPCGAWWGKGKFRAFSSEVKKFLFGENKTSVGNIRKPFLTVSVDSQISALKCCRDSEMRKVSSFSSCWSALRSQLEMGTWAMRSFRCRRHTPTLALRATCDRETWMTPHVLRWNTWQNAAEIMQICVNSSPSFPSQTPTGINKTYCIFSSWNQRRVE